jgi:MFS superfamily sulfate permease-like transporter
MVSGPAAGLTAIVLAAIAELGSFELFLAAVVIGGALQVLLGVARAGIIGYFFPSSVIRGMLAAIGLILILKQLPYAFGAGIAPSGMDDTDPASASSGGGYFGPILRAVSDVRPLAVVLTILALLILVYWPKIAPAAVRKVIPGALAAVLLGVVGVLGAAAFAPGLAIPTEAMVALPVTDSFGDLLAQLRLPDWSGFTNPVVWRVGLTIAIVASLETLLSLEATDKLDPFKRNAPANRELFAQGVGNMVAGSIGGLPMTGVIVRSTVNISAGARTWRSAFFHGVLLVFALVAIPALLNRIPLAVLAAILLHTGYKLAHPKLFRDAWRIGAQYLVPFVVTIGAILATDLLVGIIIGLAVGMFFVLKDDFSHAYSYQIEESDGDRHCVRLTLAEQVTFLNKARINEALHKVPSGSAVIVDATRTRHMDHDVVELLHEFSQNARARGISLRLLGVPEPAPAGRAH